MLRTPLLWVSLLLLWCCSCQRQVESDMARSPAPAESAAGEIRLAPEQVRALGISTLPAEPPKLHEFVALQGSVVPQSGSQVSVFPPFAGRLVARENGFPAIGQRVEQNELLADVERLVEAAESTQMAEQRRALEAEIDRLRQEWDQSKQEVERVRKLFESGLIPKNQLLQAELESRQAQIRLEEALKSKAAYEKAAQAESAPQLVELRAPISGVIEEVTVDPGQTVDVSIAVFQIVDLDVVWVETRIQEEYLPLARQSRKAEVAVPGPNPQGLPAQLLSSSPAANIPGRAEVAVYSVANRNGALTPGMPVEVRLPVSSDAADRPVCQIPSDAIFRDGNSAAVFVEAEPGVYRLRRVETGPTRDNFTAVMKGLGPGESVVVNGLAGLRSQLK